MYKEDMSVGNVFRKQYRDGLENLISSLRKDSEKKRDEFITDILKESEVYRKKFMNMLGYPLNKKFDYHDIPNVRKTFVTEDEDCKIYRLEIEVLKDLFFYGILFVKDENKKLPLIISQHGGQGTPEMCSGFSDSSNYNDMTRRILKYDVNVFAPQMLLWSKDNYGNPYDRHELDNKLKQLGSSITAIEIYSLKKSLNYLNTLEYVDENKTGMIGLSYGGFYTLFNAACDTRIKASLSCSQFNNRFVYDWHDWTWFNSANTFTDSEIAMLVYPRYLSVLVGNNDELFDFEKSIEESERVKKLCKGDTKWFNFHVFDGTHEFCKDDSYIEKVVSKLQ